MSSVLSSARVLYEACNDPATLATRLNAVMYHSTDPAHFVTLFIAYIDPRSGVVRYVNAGHNAPLVASHGTVRELPASDPPIAVLDAHTFTDEQTTLAPGDVLTVFSDGIPEALCEGVFYAEDRLRDAIVGATKNDVDAKTVRDAVMASLNAFLHGTPRGDDVTLVIVRRAG
jgi:sigma-B regulation protein RsbU (phosphoserine phosphatase)